jgi:hypothetical protein
VFVKYMVPAETRASLAKAKTVSVKRSLDSGRDGADHGVRGGRLSKSGKKAGIGRVPKERRKALIGESTTGNYRGLN